MPWIPKEYGSHPLEKKKNRSHSINENEAKKDEENKIDLGEMDLNALEKDGDEEEGEDNMLEIFGPMDFVEEGKKDMPAKEQLVEIPSIIKSQVGAAIRDFEMIKDGDKVLIAISGGKDSLALIHILKYFKQVAPINFEIGGVTVDPQVNEYKP